MKRIILCAFPLFMLVSCVSSENPEAKVYSYQEVRDPGSRISMSSDGGFYQWDAGRDTEACVRPDIFLCIDVPQFKLYFPRDRASFGSPWEVGGEKYVPSKIKKIKILGVEEEVFYVKKVSLGGEIDWYILSPERGVVGFWFEDNSGRVNSIWMLVGECGFGASSDCE